MKTKPYKKTNTKYVSYYCGECNHKVAIHAERCRYCGAEIEWEIPAKQTEPEEPEKKPQKKPNKDPPKPNVYAVIYDNGKRRAKLESWRYYEILDTLRWLHVERLDAADAAKWCMRAKPGMEFELILTGDNRVLIRIEEGA